MKNLTSKLTTFFAIVLMGVCVSAISASAFTNLSTTGGSGTSGGSGATPSLSQVTAVGATTADTTTFNGGLLATSVSSTSSTVQYLTINSTVSNVGRINMTNSSLDCGASLVACIRTDSGALAISSADAAQLYFNYDNVGFASNFYGNVQPDTNNGRDLGGATTAWRNFYVSSTALMTNVSSTAVTTTSLWVKNGFNTLNDPAIRFGTAATGLYSNGPTQIGMVLSGNSFATFDSSNYLQILQVNPQGINTGSLGRASLPWGELWAKTATTSNIFVGQEIKPTLTNFVDLGNASSSWRDIYASGTVRGDQLYLGEDRSATSTVRIGNAGFNGGCLAISDTDKSGTTYCSANNGTMTCSTSSCE